MTTWTPNHESTREAWEAVVANLQERGERGLWGSRTIATTLAQRAGGLTWKRADELIRSSIKHGYLEERPYPSQPHGHHRTQTQVRLPGATS